MVVRIVELSEMEVAVLRAMHSRAIYGKNHKRIETIIHSGFPSHLRNEVKKAIIITYQKRFYFMVSHG